jgi:hypothetical protein
MKIDTLLRAAQILRTQPARSMALVKLHSRLTDELGTDAGTYAQLYAELKKRPESFLLLDMPRLLDGAQRWPKQVREEYGSVLEGAGLGACVRVALNELPHSEVDDALSLASSTVSELWAGLETDATLREYLQRAADQLEEISALLNASEAERPTTHPPDLPRSR